MIHPKVHSPWNEIKTKPDYNDSNLIATLKYFVENRDERNIDRPNPDYDRLFSLKFKKIPKT